MGKVYRFFLKSLLLFFFFNLSAYSQWTQMNGPLGGTIWSMTSHDSILFAGADGGVFLSTDLGSSWNAANNGLPKNTSVYSILVKGPNLFAGSSNGVFLSTNNGNSWTSVNQGLPFSTNTLIVKDTNIFAGTFSGVFLSTNNGVSWKEADSGMTNKYVNYFAIKDTNIFAATNDGMFVSTNNGVSWNIIDTGLFNTNIMCLAVSGNNVLAGTSILSSDTNNTGIFLSTNNGKSWRADNTGLPTNISILSLSVVGTQIYAGTNSGFYVLGSFWSDAGSGLTRTGVHALTTLDSKMFAGNDDGVFISTNGGTNWTQSNVGLKATMVKSILSRGTNLFSTSGAIGIFINSSGNSDWTFINGGLIGINNFISDGNNLFACGSGVLLSTDKGNNWVKVDSGITAKSVFVLLIKGSTLFAGTIGGIFRSANYGTKWDSSSTGLPPNSTISSLILKDSILFAATHNGIYLSSNNGINWSLVSTGLTNTYINCLIVSDSNIFAGSNGAGIFRSTNNGASWIQVNSGLPAYLSIYSFTVDSSIIFAGTNNGLFFSKDNGTSWHDASTGLTYNTKILSLAYNNNNLYAGTWGNGVWQRPLSEIINSQLPVELTSFTANLVDNNVSLTWSTATETNNSKFEIEKKIGNTDWKNIGSVAGNGTTTKVHSYTFIDSKVDFVKATYRIKQIDLDGSYSYSKEVEVNALAPVKFELNQNYPNPFNPVTIISYSIPVSSHVRLEVYSITGQRIKILVDETQSSGLYNMRFDGSSLASGTYIYRLTAGEFMVSKKLQLIK